MKEELDKLLVTRYPKIFKNRYASMQTTAMCWGFSHGDGWFKILDNACQLIQSHIDWTRKNRANNLRFNRALKRALNGDRKGIEFYYANKYGQLSDWDRERIEKDIEKAEYRTVNEACLQVVAVQVKEKFGTLRFYYDGGDSKVDGIVRMAEFMSAATCEVCGNVGEERGAGWIRTLCDEHAKK